MSSINAVSANAEQKNSQIKIRLMQLQDVIKWDAYINANEEASFFHKAGWQRVIEQSFGHKTWFYYAEVDDEIVGVLPLAEIKSALFGHSLSSLPFCVYGGVIANNDEIRDALNQAAIVLADKLKVGHLEYRSIEAKNPENNGWVGKNLYVTFRKEINSDEEQNMLAIPRKQRAMVRKGIKLGLESEIDLTVDRFYYAYSSSVHRLGTPVFSKKFFKILKEVFQNDCEVMTIVKEGRTIASVMSFYFKDQVLPYYGGGTVEARDLAGNDFMYWELMRRACARSLKIFDFGRSKIGTGAFDFKKNWGFEPEPLQYEYKLFQSTTLPDINPLNPKYQLFIKMWQKMPLSVANLIGPHIVKNLG